MTRIPDYFVAPFASNGEPVGTAGRSLSELSPQWLEFWNKLLGAHGNVFRCSIPLPPLQHISLNFTSSNGAALVSFSVHYQLASSAVALRGTNAAAEAEVVKMFVESLRRVPFVQQAAVGPTSFAGIHTLPQRPLYVVVPWANPAIDEDDQELVQELENHLAAAFLVGTRTV